MDIKERIDYLLNFLKSDTITDSEVGMVKESLKEIDLVLKEKSKPKTLTISGSSHKAVKEYCTINGLNIGDWSSSVLLNAVNIENDKKFDELEPNVRISKEINKRLNKQLESIIDSLPFATNCLDESKLTDKELADKKLKEVESNFYYELKSVLSCEIVLMGKDFIFLGYDLVTAKPIYEYNLILAKKLELLNIKYDIYDITMQEFEDRISSTYIDGSMGFAII